MCVLRIISQSKANTTKQDWLFILNTFNYINLTVWPLNRKTVLNTSDILVGWNCKTDPCIPPSPLPFVHGLMYFVFISIFISFDHVQTPTHPLPENSLPSPPQPIPFCRIPPQPQLIWSSSVAVRMSVTRPVPIVLFPSLRVNLWPFSRTIGWRSVSVKVVSSPGITISWKTRMTDSRVVNVFKEKKKPWCVTWWSLREVHTFVLEEFNSTHFFFKDYTIWSLGKKKPY